MQVDKTQIEQIPKNSYLVIPKNVNNEDHIIKKRPTTGARIFADKLANDVFSYAPKGMQGSKNSNFYEFLSLGLIPNLVGSATLILLSNALHYGGKDDFFAGMNGRKMAGGVLMYAAGKWLGNKVINKGVKATTGIDLEMPYKKVVHELPEYKGDKNTTSVEFHKVFESVDFPRWDLINKQGEENGNRFEYYDNLAHKMGYSKELNAPDQVVQPKIREVLVKSSAAKSVSTYIWAALGCAIASQESFGTFMNFPRKPTFTEAVKKLPTEVFRVVKDGTKSLAKTKMGKGLMAAAAVTSAFGILNAGKNFKAEKEDKKSTVDYNSNHMEF